VAIAAGSELKPFAASETLLFLFCQNTKYETSLNIEKNIYTMSYESNFTHLKLYTTTITEELIEHKTCFKAVYTALLKRKYCVMRRHKSDSPRKFNATLQFWLSRYKILRYYSTENLYGVCQIWIQFLNGYQHQRK
jgi:hypothetical protein